jgi:hypothetical protein
VKKGDLVIRKLDPEATNDFTKKARDQEGYGIIVEKYIWALNNEVLLKVYWSINRKTRSVCPGLVEVVSES